ncbi:MAG: 4Fe-4S dicluster domain-containing protein [Chloroflexi bacterium]|jgi:carbon-monoxide dehydrogenase iron sulfur subunit|nr:4Fe-4S dicluster domain-containing protein [Anaerolineaceae bacterium]NMB89367.1 4Fe-4S dicluster domain-containing protein [Chloroflexota bacterium]
MAKILMIHPERCVGCDACMMACAFEHEGSQRLAASRVHIYTWDEEGISVPMLCQQCSDAACVTVCPTGAMHRNPDTALIELDASRCIRCRMCTMACPFGNAVYDALTDSIFKCDTCFGDPACVKKCPSDALVYVDDTISNKNRQRDFAAKMKDAIQGSPV